MNKKENCQSVKTRYNDSNFTLTSLKFTQWNDHRIDHLIFINNAIVLLQLLSSPTITNLTTINNPDVIKLYSWIKLKEALWKIQSSIIVFFCGIKRFFKRALKDYDIGRRVHDIKEERKINSWNLIPPYPLRAAGR